MIQKKGKDSLALKVSWGTAISFCLFGLSYYVQKSYVKYEIAPELLVNARYIQRSEIPFPAITICPPTPGRVDMLNVSKFAEEIAQKKTPSIEDQTLLATIGQVCLSFGHYLKDISPNDDYDENVMEILSKAGFHVNQTLSFCNSGNENMKGNDCGIRFARTITNYGYCFTFNMLDHSSIFADDISSDFDGYKDKDSENSEVKWTLEKRYLTNEKLVKPLKSAEVDNFRIYSTLDKKEIPNFCPYYQGNFRIMLHMPNEIPSDMHTLSFFGFNKTKNMKITASVKSLDISVKKYPLDLRKCYFEGEKQLRFFKIYTLSNCVHECVSNFTFKECGCVFIGSPRTNNMKVCGIKKVRSCINPIQWKWPSSYYKYPENVKSFKDYPCNCMPTCTEIDYQFTEETIFEWDNLNTNTKLNGHIFLRFSYRNIIETTGYVTYQLQNFICDIGGLASLFLGFSLLTMFKGMLMIVEYASTKLLALWNKLRGRSVKDEKRSNIKNKKNKNRIMIIKVTNKQQNRASTIHPVRPGAAHGMKKLIF